LAGSVNGGGLDLGLRLEAVRARIDRAAARAGRARGSIRLIGVTKGVAPERVRQAVELGVTELGENRVQEAEAKIAAVGRSAAVWHLIGPLQRNKAGRALELFDQVQTVDRAELADALARRAQAAGRVLPVLVEVNVAQEASKFGVAPEGLEALLEVISQLPGLAPRGLMTVGPRVDRPEDARATFAALRALQGRARAATGLTLDELSMGMSDDFEVAVEEGATMVRIGSALFGPRG
jgi:pyridoxal phosphate enzyme (YggS family)